MLVCTRHGKTSENLCNNTSMRVCTHSVLHPCNVMNINYVMYMYVYSVWYTKTEKHVFLVPDYFLLFFSKHLPDDWLERMYHSCQHRRPPIPDTLDHPELHPLLMAQLVCNCDAVLWFWATYESAQYCLLARLRTPLGLPNETFSALEGNTCGCMCMCIQSNCSCTTHNN